jgi:hypothetical protein
MKQGDRQPKLQADLNVDLTTATSVVAKLRRFHQTTVLSKTMTVTDQVNGIVETDWGAGDTDTPGTYAVEFLVTWSGGTTQRFPQASNKELVIRPRVGT